MYVRNLELHVTSEPWFVVKNSDFIDPFDRSKKFETQECTKCVKV